MYDLDPRTLPLTLPRTLPLGRIMEEPPHTADPNCQHRLPTLSITPTLTTTPKHHSNPASQPYALSQSRLPAVTSSYHACHIPPLHIPPASSNIYRNPACQAYIYIAYIYIYKHYRNPAWQPYLSTDCLAALIKHRLGLQTQPKTRLQPRSLTSMITQSALGFKNDGGIGGFLDGAVLCSTLIIG